MEIARAGAALEKARGATSDRIVVLGTAVETYEAALSALRDGLGASVAREQALALGLATRRGEVMRLLAALEAMSRTPPPAQALHPQGPLGAARAAAMMARLTPAMTDEASKLSGALAELAAVRRLTEQGRAELGAGLAALGAAQAELAAAMAEDAPMPAESVGPALTMMARDSETLTQLAAALADSADAAPAPSNVEPGPMAWPVIGDVASRFNEPDAAGVRRPGIVLRTAPLALVRAPVDAVVRYAGPFLEYGYVVVIEPRADEMVVLAGLAQLQVRTGEPVRRGDLLGLLGGRALDVEEYVMLPRAETGAGGSETLYIEVRRDTGPVDPESLFAADDKG